MRAKFTAMNKITAPMVPADARSPKPLSAPMLNPTARVMAISMETNRTITRAGVRERGCTWPNQRGSTPSRAMLNQTRLVGLPAASSTAAALVKPAMYMTSLSGPAALPAAAGNGYEAWTGAWVLLPKPAFSAHDMNT